jgi:hypothetical protein
MCGLARETLAAVTEYLTPRQKISMALTGRTMKQILQKDLIRHLPVDLRHKRLRNPRERALFTEDEFLDLLDWNQINVIFELLRLMNPQKERQKITLMDQELEKKILDYNFRKNIKNVLIKNYLEYLQGARRHERFYHLTSQTRNPEIRSRLIGEYVRLEDLDRNTLEILARQNILPTVANILRHRLESVP